MSSKYTGSNSTYGSAKRKRGSNPSMAASKLSRKLFYKAPVVNIDKAIGRALSARHIVPPEQKYKEIVSTSSAVNSTETLVLLNGLALGSTDQQRLGTKIRVTKVEFNGFIGMSATAAGGSDVGKVSLFMEKQVNQATVAFATAVNSDTLSPYTDTGNSVMLKNANTEKQFYIIKDWDYALNATAGTVGFYAQNQMRLKCEVPINRITSYDNGNNGDVTDIISNAFYLGWQGAQPPGAEQSVIAYIVRIWYTDA